MGHKESPAGAGQGSLGFAIKNIENGGQVVKDISMKSILLVVILSAVSIGLHIALRYFFL